MRRGALLPQFFLGRGNLHSFHRQENHSYDRSGWPWCTSQGFSGILILHLAIVKLTLIWGFDLALM
jgi:hypothetical protein